MAIIKCKMCGGDLVLVEGTSVAECEYCGTRQTVPTADNEKKLTLFGRAGRLLRACEFDKAAGVYEGIVAEFPEEAEAYWGLVLCKYGIEYVDDPSTGRKIPTCHRSSFDSVLDDENFDQAYENADEVAKRVYRDEAKAIEELRRGIIEVSGREAPYDVFICYKETDSSGERTLDSVLAQDIYDALTEKGYRVFFSRVTLEDKLGQEYEPYIFAALNSAKVMLAVGTDYQHFDAVWVKNEWSRFLKLIAGGQKKTLIPCYKGIDAYDMPKEFAKLQAQDLGKVGAMQDLLRGVDKILGKGAQNAQAQAPAQTIVQQVSGGPNADSLLKRGQIFLSDGDWAKADEYFDKALDIDPECARAYLGKLLASRKAKDAAALAAQLQEIEADPLFQKAQRYADEAYRAELNGLNASVQAAKRSVEQEKEARSMELKPFVTRSAAAQKRIAAGLSHTVGLKVDGTVVAVGENRVGQCNVSGWRDIVAIAAGSSHTVGLRSDGTVVATGLNGNGECDVWRWTDIVAIAAGSDHTVGLKSDGTVVATARRKDELFSSEYGQRDVSSWRDIVAVAAGKTHTVGLKSDGTVKTTVILDRRSDCGQDCVFDWRDIAAIAAGNDHTVGVKSDGTVVAVGSNLCGKSEVSEWTDIVAVAAGSLHTVGLKSDGTVVTAGEKADGRCDVSDWTDIVAIAVGGGYTVGLKSDGTVVTAGENEKGQCNVSDWKLFNNADRIEEEVREVRIAAEEKRRKDAEARRAAEEQRRKERIESLNREAESLKAELANLHGLFAGKRRKEIESRLEGINYQLSGLKK